MKRLAIAMLAAVFLCNSNLQLVMAANAVEKSDWAAKYMQSAYQAGLISDTLMKNANADITRLEFCKMAVQFYKNTGKELPEVPSQSPFTDCNDKDVLLAYKAGFISGIEKDKFLPARELTREELAILTVRLCHACGLDLMPYAKQAPFTDTKKLSKTSQKYIEALYGAGLVSGYKDGSFRPRHTVQVKEATVVLQNALKLYKEKSGTALKEEPAKTQPKKELEKPTAKPEEQAKSEAEMKASEINQEHKLQLLDKEIALGQSQQEVEKIWGEPLRIDRTVYDLQRYIYQPSPTQYLMATLQDGKVVAIFAIADEFSYNDVAHIRTTKDIAAYTRFSNFSNYAIWHTQDAEISFCIDFQGNTRGVSLRAKDFAIGEGLKISEDTGVYANMEQELLESINTLRAMEGNKPLQWDEYLHMAATEHSKDMVHKGYFAYDDLDGKTPFQRMYEKEKNFHTATEVIVRAKGDVPELYTEMIRSAGKYHSILDETMSHGGIGVAISISSHVASVTVDICGLKK